MVLRDGRTLIGILRSVDQFANLVLHRTIERIHVGKEYGDIPRGVFIVRGENVALLGEIVIFTNSHLLLIILNTLFENTFLSGYGERRQNSLETGQHRRYSRSSANRTGRKAGQRKDQAETLQRTGSPNGSIRILSR